MNKLSVLIVDDHPLMREALRGAIEDEPDLILIGEACDGNEALALMQALQPDVILLDLMMPGKDGLTAIPEMLELDPQARIMVLSSSQEVEKITAAVESGVLGYLTKDVQRVKLLHGIRTVGAGKSYLPETITEKLMTGLREKNRRQSSTKPLDSLTSREQTIFSLISEGASNREIARRLYISDATVRTHVHNILQKLQLESRSQAILYSSKMKVQQ